MKTIVAFSLLLISTSSSALFIDFTNEDWSNVSDSNPYPVTYSWGTVTLSSNVGSLTYNQNDGASGCGGSQTGADNALESPPYSLACDGDGIGIGDDEISQGGKETLTVSFDKTVNILDVYFLDLFINDVQGGDGSPPKNEVAVLNFGYGDIFINSSGITDYPGGYWESSWDSDWIVQNGISSFTLTGNSDTFSDYSLAKIDFEVSVVPEPSIIALFAVGLFGLGFARRGKNN